MSLVFNHAGAETHDELVARYMRASGKDQSHLKELVSTEPSAMSGLPKSIEQKFGVFVEQGHKETRRLYSSNLDDDTLLKLIAWYESPLGKKILVQTGKRTTDTEALRTFINEFSKRPNAKQRVELLNRLDSITRYSDTMSDWLYEFMQATFSALTMNPSTNTEGNKKSTSYNDMMKNNRGVLVALMKSGISTTLPYMYRNLTDDELNAYIAFHETAAGRKEAECTNLLLGHILGLWTEFSRKNSGVVIYMYVHGLNNAPPQHIGEGKPVLTDKPAGISMNDLSRLATQKEIRADATSTKQGVVEYSECDVFPSLATDSKPKYPEMARLAGIQGRVFVRVLIDEQGRAAKAGIVKRVPADTNIFDKAAMDYIMSARFSPGEQNGKKVKVWMTIPVRFLLQDKTISPEQGATQKEMVR